MLADYLFAALVLAAIAFSAAWLSGATGEVFAGPFRAVDGDSLEAEGRRFRLQGIDAPEYGQLCRRDGRDWACGREASLFLSRLVSGSRARCRSHGEDRYGRLLVRCRTGDTDINAAMVEAGLAVAFGDYDLQEAAARAGSKGVWAGDFIRPKDWRQIHGGMDETIAAPDINRWMGRFADRLAAWFEMLRGAEEE
jgi:endonuclease YncB( thermonuclease family)